MKEQKFINMKKEKKKENHALGKALKKYIKSTT